jgi:hypothetical protein
MALSFDSTFSSFAGIRMPLRCLDHALGKPRVMISLLVTQLLELIELRREGKRRRRLVERAHRVLLNISFRRPDVRRRSMGSGVA